MTTALDKILMASSGGGGNYLQEDVAGEMVLAATSVLQDALVMLAAAKGDEDADDDMDEDDWDEDDDSKKKGKGKFGGKKAPPFGKGGSKGKVAATSVLLAGSSDDDSDDGDWDDDDHAKHGTYKKLVKKGVNAKLAAKMCAKSDKMKATAALIEAATITLSGLEMPETRLSWVERTASGGLLALASGGAPRTGIPYADPGYRSDGKRRLPLDTENHIRLSWAWLAGEGGDGYSAGQLSEMASRIKAAAGRHGIDTIELAVLNMADRKKSSAHTIPGSTDYPIPDKGHLSSAIARYKEGKLAGHSASEVKSHIVSRAKALGVQVDL